MIPTANARELRPAVNERGPISKDKKSRSKSDRNNHALSRDVRYQFRKKGMRARSGGTFESSVSPSSPPAREAAS